MAGDVAVAGQVLRLPTERDGRDSNLARYLRRVQGRHPDLGTPHDLWRWSVEDPDAFWRSMWELAELPADPPATVRQGAMPSTTWFPGASLNYAECALRRRDDHVAVVFRSEDDARDLTYAQLAEEVRRIAAGLRRLGVRRGDTVAAYLPSRPETVIAFLATAAVGAVWTACSPDFGLQSVRDRFQQVEPSVLLTVHGYRYNGQWHDRSEVVDELVAALPSVRAVVDLASTGRSATTAGSTLTWADLAAPTDEPLTFEHVPFDHPLWVVYTSGTTGLPKSIVHGHGGVVLEHHKLLRLHLDLGADDRFFWFTTTGWVMWNIVVGGLLLGATIVLYDGSPTHPDPERLWDLANETGATFFGCSAGFVHAALRDGQRPTAHRDLSHVRAVGITGSPLSVQGHQWLYDALGDVFVCSISGGTDVCTAFLGSSPLLPQRAGELQGACLGVAAACYDEAGRDVTDQVGELVITEPIPSMPIRFWGDASGARYRESYFDVYPGVWRHGDWVRRTPAGTWVVYGRSDATLNRGGVRMGTSDFYAALDTIPEVADSVVIDTTTVDSPTGRLVLLVSLREGELDDRLAARIRDTLRRLLSPRHAPDDIIAVPALPHTLNGKRLEVPIRKLFLDPGAADVVDRSAIDDAVAFDEVIDVARRWRNSTTRA